MTASRPPRPPRPPRRMGRRLRGHPRRIELESWFDGEYPESLGWHLGRWRVTGARASGAGASKATTPLHLGLMVPTEPDEQAAQAADGVEVGAGADADADTDADADASGGAWGSVLLAPCPVRSLVGI